MKRYILGLLGVFVFTTLLNASAPNEIRYTGRLKAYQAPVTDTVNMTFKLYYQETGGNSVWTSGSVSVSVSSGIFTYVLKPSGIDWSRGDVWLELTVGTNILSPREKLMSQPYSFHSLTAENGVPAGTVIAYAGQNVPKGYFPCDGRTLSRTDYPELFDAIGTIYGGSGSTFNLPNFQGMFLRGAGSNTVTTNPGGTVTITSENLGVKQTDAIRNITGNFTGLGVGNHSTNVTEPSGVFSTQSSGSDKGAVVDTGTIFGNYSQRRNILFNASKQVPTANENRPANYSVNYCIKY